MPAPNSAQQARLGINQVLTNLAWGYGQPENVMQLAYPVVPTPTYGGQIIAFDDSDYEEISDDRADGADYPEVQDGYQGRPFKVKYKGLKYIIPDKRAREMANLGINWGQRAVNSLMFRAGLQHEKEAAALATTINTFAPTNRVTLTTGSQFNEASTDPDPVIREAMTTIAERVGRMPNVKLLGRRVFNSMAAKYANNFTSTGTSVGLRQQLTTERLAELFGFQKVAIVDAIRKTSAGNNFIFGKHIWMGYTNPEALNREKLTYRTNGIIDLAQPSAGYTYCYQNNPLIYGPGRNEEKQYTYYLLDFDRSVENVGVDETSGLVVSAYLIANAVA